MAFNPQYVRVGDTITDTSNRFIRTITAVAPYAWIYGDGSTNESDSESAMLWLATRKDTRHVPALPPHVRLPEGI